MSRWDEDYETRRERERQESREYHGDVVYDVWRSGRNPDAINYDRVEDSRWAGMTHEEAASREIRAQSRRREEYNDEEAFEEHCRQHEYEQSEPEPEDSVDPLLTTIALL